MKFIYLILLSISISLSCWSVELTRLDDFGTESIDSKYPVNLFIAENCSVCHEQIEILKYCLGSSKVAVYIEGPSEERLRTYVKRKKIPFKTFHLNQDAKNLLNFKNKSPALTIIANKTTTQVGLTACLDINLAIKAGNLNPRK